MLSLFAPTIPTPQHQADLLQFIGALALTDLQDQACLHWRDDTLFYGLVDDKLDKVFCFDLQKEWNCHQGKNYSLKNEPLAKSLGIKGDGSSLVIDATCGTGKDSVLLLKFGARVHAFERNPVVAALFFDALRRATQAGDKLSELLTARFRYSFLSAIDFSISEEVVIYLDPMYPHPEKKKSALPRKEMQLFRLVVGDDLDADQLFAWAYSSAAKRVVVKRPLDAPLIHPQVVHRYEGKSTRYDLYIPVNSLIGIS